MRSTCVKVRGQLPEVDFFLLFLLYVPGLELRLPALHSKCLYTVSQFADSYIHSFNRSFKKNL